MAPFVDRTAELTAIDAALAEAGAHQRALVVALEGPYGIGKSALLDEYLERVSARARTARVQAQRLDRLGTGTLEADVLAGAEVVGVDNAQWLNRPCRDVLLRAMRERQLRLLLLAYDDGPPAIAVPIDVRIVLEPLAPEDIARIAGSRESARRAHGSPYEAAMLAKLDPQAVSSARAVAQFISQLPPHARTLAQMLSLIASPVDPSFMQAIAPDARERNAALELLAPLLKMRDGNVEFDHALTASAVAETIPMKIPLHRRIIAAIERTGVESLPQRMLLVEQLLGSGDRAQAQAHALELAFEAERVNAPHAQLWASSRHLELGEPPSGQFLKFYVQFITALIAQHEFERAEAVASHALSEAQRHDVVGIVPLAARLIQAQWAQDRQTAAHASYERYAQALTDQNDLAQLRAAAPWLRAS